MAQPHVGGGPWLLAETNLKELAHRDCLLRAWPGRMARVTVQAGQPPLSRVSHVLGFVPLSTLGTVLVDTC